MIIWKPNGFLNIASDPSDLPQESDTTGKIIRSDALVRCKNLQVSEKGTLYTRDGANKLNSIALSGTPTLLMEQGGVRFVFTDTNIYRDEVSILSSGISSGRWSAIKYNSYNSSTQNIFALNGTDRKRIEGSSVYEWGITAPTVAPTVATGALTGLTGTYKAKYSYARKEGSTVVCESNLSPASTGVSLTNESLSVTPTASSDSQVTHIRVYRTLTNGSIYYHDQDIAVGTTSLDTNTGDGSLGEIEHTDHDRPPFGSFVIGPNYNGTCFILKDNRLYFCKPKQPEYWPTSYYVEVENLQDPLKAASFYAGQLYALTGLTISHIQGSGSNTFFPVPTDAVTGTQSPICALSIKGQGLFHLGFDGVYIYAGEDVNFIENTLYPLFRTETREDIPAVDLSKLDKSWLAYYHGKLFFCYCSTDDTYPKHCLVFHVLSKRAAYYTWGVEFPVVGYDQRNDRILAVDSSGYVWQLENVAMKTDDGTDIDFDAKSKSFILQTRLNFPRWAKYDVDASKVSTCIGEITVDETPLQLHTISGNRNVKRRLIDIGNGARSAIRIYGSGVVKIYAAELE